MAEDTSLTEFIGAASDDDKPAESTFAWHPDGMACDACGEPVERRWAQSGSLVCAACKSWGER